MRTQIIYWCGSSIANKFKSIFNKLLSDAS